MKHTPDEIKLLTTLVDIASRQPSESAQGICFVEATMKKGDPRSFFKDIKISPIGTMTPAQSMSRGKKAFEKVFRMATEGTTMSFAGRNPTLGQYGGGIAFEYTETVGDEQVEHITYLASSGLSEGMDEAVSAAYWLMKNHEVKEYPSRMVKILREFPENKKMLGFYNEVVKTLR